MLTVNLNSQMKYSVQPQSHAALRKKEIAAIKHKAVCTCYLTVTYQFINKARFRLDHYCLISRGGGGEAGIFPHDKLFFSLFLHNKFFLFF